MGRKYILNLGSILKCIYVFRKYTAIRQDIKVDIRDFTNAFDYSFKDGDLILHINIQLLNDKIEREWITVKDILQIEKNEYYEDFFLNLIAQAVSKTVFDEEAMAEIYSVYLAKLAGAYPHKPHTEIAARYWERITNLGSEYEKIPHVFIPPELQKNLEKRYFWVISQNRLFPGLPLIVNIGRDEKHSVPCCVAMCIHGEKKRFRDITQHDVRHFGFNSVKDFRLAFEKLYTLILEAEIVYIAEVVEKEKFMPD